MQTKPVCFNCLAAVCPSLCALSISRSTPLLIRISASSTSCSTNKSLRVLRGSGSIFLLQFLEDHRLFAQIQGALLCFNVQLKPKSFNSGSSREQLINSLALKTTGKMVHIGTSTSSCPMVLDLLREMRIIQLSMTILYQVMLSKGNDQSVSTTKTPFVASPSLIRMGHYSRRSD